MSAPIPLRPDVGATARAAVTSLTRAAIATGLRYVSPVGAEKKSWPGDRDVELVLRAPSAPATTVNSAALAHISTAFLSALVPFSAAAALVARSLQLTFDGNATISLPTLTLPLADFVQEGKPIPVAMGSSSAGVVLSPFKIAVLVTLTSEMLRYTAAETIVQRILLDNTGPSLDAAMFSAAAAVADVRPAGLLNGVSALTPSASTTKSEAMADDVCALAAAVGPVSGNAAPVLIAPPAQATALQMRSPSPAPFPVLVSSSLPPKRLICVAAPALVTAFGVPEITGSKSSALHFAAPTAADIADGGGTVAFPVKGLFQIDAAALKLRLPVAWALRSPQAIAFVDNVTW
jgi:hypothetical protein